MISPEEAQKRMNGRYGGSKSFFPCSVCIIDHDCPCETYELIGISDSPQWKEMSDDEKALFKRCRDIARHRLGNAKIGYPCETLNRWLFGLDDDQE